MGLAVRGYHEVCGRARSWGDGWSSQLGLWLDGLCRCLGRCLCLCCCWPGAPAPFANAGPGGHGAGVDADVGWGRGHVDTCARVEWVCARVCGPLLQRTLKGAGTFGDFRLTPSAIKRMAFVIEPLTAYI